MMRDPDTLVKRTAVSDARGEGKVISPRPARCSATCWLTLWHLWASAWTMPEMTAVRTRCEPLPPSDCREAQGRDGVAGFTPGWVRAKSEAIRSEWGRSESRQGPVVGGREGARLAVFCRHPGERPPIHNVSTCTWSSARTSPRHSRSRPQCTAPVFAVRTP